MNQSQPMTRLEVVDIETLEVKKAVYLAGHNAQEIQSMSDSLLRSLNTFQFFVRATPSAAPVVQAPVAAPAGWKLVPINPTDEMLEAIEQQAIAQCSVEFDSNLGSRIHFGDAAEVYADALKFAPSPATLGA